MIRIRTTATIAFALLAGAFAPAGEAERTVLAMGTVLKVRVEAPDALRAEAAAEAALREIGRIEAACSTWIPDSDFSRLNRAGGRAVPLAAEWLDLLACAQAWSRRTEGAFDPLLRALMEAWDVRGRGRHPSEAERVQALRASGAGRLHLDRLAGTARLEGPHAGLEEGGFAKGYALDRALAEARRAGATVAWFDFGGQILAAGAVEAAVAHPVHRERPALALALRDASLSTSGSSERGRHILDPRTGRPCPAWGSVSVVARSAFEADVLSTALYAMGPGEGLAWARRHAIAACFLTPDGPARMTREFKAQLIPEETR